MCLPSVLHNNAPRVVFRRWQSERGMRNEKGPHCFNVVRTPRKSLVKSLFVVRGFARGEVAVYYRAVSFFRTGGEGGSQPV